MRAVCFSADQLVFKSEKVLVCTAARGLILACALVLGFAAESALGTPEHFKAALAVNVDPQAMVACVQEVARSSQVSSLCKAVFILAAPSVDSVLYAQRRERPTAAGQCVNAEAVLFPFSPDLFACLSREEFGLLMVNTALYSPIRGDEYRRFMAGMNVLELKAIGAGAATLLYRVFVQKALRKVIAALAGAATGTVVAASVAVAGAAATGYFVGEVIVAADGYYLNGVIVSKTGAVIGPAIDFFFR